MLSRQGLPGVSLMRRRRVAKSDESRYDDYGKLWKDLEAESRRGRDLDKLNHAKKAL